MSDDVISVKFGAGATELIASLGVAQAQLSKAQGEFRKLASEMVAAGQVADIDFRQKLGLMGSSAMATQVQVAALEKQLASLNGGGHGGGDGVAGLSTMQTMESIHVLKAFIDEVVAGQNPLRALAMEGGRIGQIISMGIPAAIVAYAGLAAGALAVAGGIGYLVYQQIAYNSAVKEMDLQRVIDQFQGLGQASSKVVTAISKAADVSYSDAAKIAAPFNELGPGGEKIAQIASYYLPMLSQAMGTTAVKAADDLAKKFADLKGEGEKYVTGTVGLSHDLKAQYQAFLLNGNAAGAWGIILQALTIRLEEGRNALAQHKAETLDFAESIAVAGADLGGFVLAEQLLKDNLSSTTTEIEKQKSAIAGLRSEAIAEGKISPVIAAQKEADADKIVKKTLVQSAMVQQLSGEYGQLAEQLNIVDQSTRAGESRATELNTAMRMISNQIAEAQEKSTDGVLGRNAFAHAQDQIKALEATFSGSVKSMLEQEIVILKFKGMALRRAARKPFNSARRSPRKKKPPATPVTATSSITRR